MGSRGGRHAVQRRVAMLVPRAHQRGAARQREHGCDARLAQREHCEVQRREPRARLLRGERRSADTTRPPGGFAGLHGGVRRRAEGGAPLGRGGGRAVTSAIRAPYEVTRAARSASRPSDAATCSAVYPSRFRAATCRGAGRDRSKPVKAAARGARVSGGPAEAQRAVAPPPGPPLRSEPLCRRIKKGFLSEPLYGQIKKGFSKVDDVKETFLI